MITNLFFQALNLVARPAPDPRPAIEIPAGRQRMYASAQVNRLTEDFQNTNTSADSETVTSLRNLRARSRQLVRDNDYAKNAIRHIATNVVGTGIGMRASVKTASGELDTSINDQIHAAWDQWKEAGSCDVSGKLSFHDMERLIITSLVENGEVLIRKVRQPFGRSRIALSLQLIESDQLMDQWQNGRANNGNIIKMGVEMDTYNRPVAYWLYPVHPGDFLFQVPVPSAFIRVPADDIIHLYIPNRVGQTRGIPWLHTTILRMQNLGGYEKAEIIRARASANVMGIITAPEAPVPELIQDGQRQEYMEPGEIKHLLPGEAWDFANPSAPNPAAGPFLSYMLRGAASGIGISYESLTGDYSLTNYSSSRLGQFNERDQFRTIQQFFIRNVRQNIHREFIKAAVDAQVVTPPMRYFFDPIPYEAALFKPRGWGWTSPKDDVPAYTQAVRSGFMTVAQVNSETSGTTIDVGELWQQRKREVDLADENMLVFDTDPSMVNLKGLRQPVVGENFDDTTITTEKPA